MKIGLKPVSLLRLLIVFAIWVQNIAYGTFDILSTQSASFFIISGTMGTDHTDAYLYNSLYWGKGCMVNARN